MKNFSMEYIPLLTDDIHQNVHREGCESFVLSGFPVESNLMLFSRAVKKRSWRRMHEYLPAENEMNKTFKNFSKIVRKYFSQTIP